jgi:predicted metal-dependent hydrolase
LGDRHEAAARGRFERWYRAQAEEVITERVRLFAVRSGLAFQGLRISGAKSRWGSCSSKGTLNFSWRLIMAPLWVVDYVVVHELSHLVEHNHSKRFWAHVARYFPDYTNARRWLRENQQLLEI